MCLFQSSPGMVMIKLRPAKKNVTSANESGENQCVGGCLIGGQTLYGLWGSQNAST